MLQRITSCGSTLEEFDKASRERIAGLSRQAQEYIELFCRSYWGYVMNQEF